LYFQPLKHNVHACVPKCGDFQAELSNKNVWKSFVTKVYYLTDISHLFIIFHCILQMWNKSATSCNI